MAKSALTTINQIMSIASKAHYMNGGNASKILAKDKKGIFTIEQVAETLQCDPAELKAMLQQNQIMCGDYVIIEEWGDGEKLSTFALRTLNDAMNKPQKKCSPITTYIVCGGIGYGIFGLFGIGIIGLLLGLVLAYISVNNDKIIDDQIEAQRLQRDLPEDHKPEGMM